MPYPFDEVNSEFTDKNTSPLPIQFQKKRLNPRDASDYLRKIYGVKCARSTLSWMRCRGGGPVFCKIGSRIFYARQDLDQWVESKTSKQYANTAEY